MSFEGGAGMVSLNRLQSSISEQWHRPVLVHVRATPSFGKQTAKQSTWISPVEYGLSFICELISFKLGCKTLPDTWAPCVIISNHRRVSVSYVYV